MDTRNSQDVGAKQGAFDAECGATAVEYSIVLAAIAAVIVGVVISMGTQVLGIFESFHAHLGALLGG